MVRTVTEGVVREIKLAVLPIKYQFFAVCKIINIQVKSTVLSFVFTASM